MRAGDAGSNIYVINADGTGLRQLTHDSADQSPTWSPNGKSIVYVHMTPSDSSKSALYAMRSDGSNQHLLLAESPATSAVISYPAWSPDGRKLAFDSQRTGNLAIWIYTPATRSAYQLTSSFGVAPTWSPDGRRIAYASAGTGIVVASADGTNANQIHQADDESPIWSPDGKWIALRAYNLGSQGGDSLVVMRPDGTGRRTILSGGVIFSLAWSPASNAILYWQQTSLASPTQPAALSIVSINGGTPHRLARTLGAIGTASWHR